MSTPGDPDIALALWSHLARALGPLGVRVGPELLPILRDLRAQGLAPFGASGLLRTDMLEALALMVEDLREYAARPDSGGGTHPVRRYPMR